MYKDVYCGIIYNVENTEDIVYVFKDWGINVVWYIGRLKIFIS